MNKRALLKDLPRSMCERAVDARKLAFKNPKLIDVDDQMLPWIYDRKNDVWLSFDGNYSKTSPLEKRERELEKEERLQEYENIAQQKAIDQITVCPTCHRAAENKLYNPEWVKP